ncbi:LuxR C-terminal-related transcriptional regulator [Pseudovibrio sp. SPO723]|uniref:LuxR C-terminal-related transcriptional regulator n=1 Tax=Nesiotobacter zosterae TaxID=392721 RepID=UPI0029C38120|nr:LuxR C-terminal-related transcriptional regulator [Pseudovibrio sp. SPO723]MDX5594406.1 LuxR C-terminal-related transcriptional regulator [Pseudovibrio sp. SPO723]
MSDLLLALPADQRDRIWVRLDEKHAALIEEIIAAPEPVAVIEAPAGSGKTTLVQRLAERLNVELTLAPSYRLGKNHQAAICDMRTLMGEVQARSVLDEQLEKCILTRRPNWNQPWCDKLVLYGTARVFSWQDLCLSRAELGEILPEEQAEQLYADTRGWPWLIRAVLEDSALTEQRAVSFLLTYFLQQASLEELAVLRLVLEHEDGLRCDAALKDRVFEVKRHFQPLITSHGDKLCWALPRLVDAARVAVGLRIKEHEETPVRLVTSSLLYENKMVPQAICELQLAGREEEATRLFARHGGPFFLFRYGRQAFADVLRGFAADNGSEAVISSRALAAAKAGDSGRAMKIMSDAFGEDYADLSTAFRATQQFSVLLRSVRLILATYEDQMVSEETVHLLDGLIREIPSTDHFSRGSFYHSMMELHMRTGEMEEAEKIAKWAIYHYEQAEVPLLMVSVRIYQCNIALKEGEIPRAAAMQEEAEKLLESMGMEAETERRFNRLVKGCIAYERGDPQPLLTFIDRDMEAFAIGEMWPSLADSAVYFGAQVLNRHRGMGPARSFLEGWRVNHWQAPHFRFTMIMRRVELLQDNGRWIEAEQHLETIQGRITRQWVESAKQELAKLTDANEISVALTWMRQIAFERPKKTELLEQLDMFLGNYEVTRNQARMLTSVKAFVARRQKNTTLASTVFLQLLSDAARSDSIGSLYEDIIFLEELVNDRQIRSFILSRDQLQDALNSLTKADETARAERKDETDPLTRMERRVLMIVAEGASNKYAANMLGLSEATVKFHLKNTYRKLGCKRRSEAIATARSMGMIGA